MTVRQNIAFGLELRGIPKAERNARAESVARTLQLEAYSTGWRGPQGLTAGLRPESMSIRADKPLDPALPARLLLSEMTGSDIIPASLSIEADEPVERVTARPEFYL